jgi:hypothetical protein
LVAFITAEIFITYGIYNSFGDLFQKTSLVPQIEKLFVMDVNAITFTDW